MLNKEQKILSEKLVEFIKNGSGIFMVLGAGGTGKTFTICTLEYNFLFLAPTHKAKGVLASQLKSNGINKPECITSARFLGFSKYKDENNKDVLYYKGHDENQIKNNRPIVIDEISMLKDEEILKIKEISKNNPVILLGDWLQIPPVIKEKTEKNKLYKHKGFLLSNIFRPELRTNLFTLTIQNRQKKDSPIFTLINDFRLKTNKKNNYKDLLSYVDNKNILHFDLYSNDFKEFAKNNDCVGVGRTNLTSNFLNYYIGKIKSGVDKYYIKKIYNNEKIFFSDYYFDGKKKGYSQNEFVMGKRENKVETISFQDEDIFTQSFEYINGYRMKSDKASKKMYSWSRNMRRKFKGNKQKLIEINNFVDKFHISCAKTVKGNGITSHKSQGSTYENVIIPLSDYIQSLNYTPYREENQILYVALSRAKKRIIFVDFEYNWKKQPSKWNQEQRNFLASKNDWLKYNGEEIKENFNINENEEII